MFDDLDDIRDFLAHLRQSRRLLRQQRAQHNGASGPSTWSTLGDLLAPIPWDWPGWLPRGFLTLLASKPGAGKSTLCLHLAATYLSGLTWPDGADFDADRGKVLWCESESSHALNLERARNWGLDLARILSPLDNPLHNFKLDNRHHYKALLQFARRDDVRLVILDSLGGLRSQGSNAVPIGNLVFALADLARIAGKPVLLTHHFRKRTGHHTGLPPDLDRLLGASSITRHLGPRRSGPRRPRSSPALCHQEQPAPAPLHPAVFAKNCPGTLAPRRRNPAAHPNSIVPLNFSKSS